MGYVDREDTLLLESYYVRPVNIDETIRFFAANIYVDFLWTIWELTE